MNFEDKAYAFAAAFQGIKPKGSTPTVKYVKKLQANGRAIVGKYRCYRIWRWVIWDRMWIVKNGYEWSCTCHEMSHALDARLGLRKDENMAEAVERSAAQAGRPK